MLSLFLVFFSKCNLSKCCSPPPLLLYLRSGLQGRPSELEQSLIEGDLYATAWRCPPPHTHLPLFHFNRCFFAVFSGKTHLPAVAITFFCHSHFMRRRSSSSRHARTQTFSHFVWRLQMRRRLTECFGRASHLYLPAVITVSDSLRSHGGGFFENLRIFNQCWKSRMVLEFVPVLL